MHVNLGCPSPAPITGTAGTDLNGDGDFLDNNEDFPLPPRASGNLVGIQFAGLEVVSGPSDTTQPVFDYALDGPTGYIAAILGTGFAYDGNGTIPRLPDGTVDLNAIDPNNIIAAHQFRSLA